MHTTKNIMFDFILTIALIWINAGQCSGTGDNVTYTITSDTSPDCSLKPKVASVQEEVLRFTDSKANVRLVKYKFIVNEDNGPFSPNSTVQNLFLKPYDLAMALDAAGKSLLMLKEYFQPMSLHTLGYGVAEITVHLIQEPQNCLKYVHAEDLERKLKIMIFRNFGNATQAVLSDKEVCNQQIHVGQDKTGSVKYSCCKIDVQDKLLCRDLEQTVWITALFTIIIILQVVGVLYSPGLVPSGGRMGIKFLDYVYKPAKSVQLNVIKVDANADICDRRFVKSRQFPFIKLQQLKEKLRNLESGVMYSLIVSQIYLSVKANKILPDGYSPVSFGKFLKDFFVRCKIRKELPAFKTCCKANIFGKCKYFEVPWYKCLTPLMWLIVGIIMTSPWLLRVWFFYVFEKNSIETLNRVLTNKGFKPVYPGSVILYLTPTHIIFLLIYVTIPVEVIVYTYLPAAAKRKLQFTLQMSMKSMRTMKKFDALVAFIVHMLFPLKEFGIIGILILPLWFLAMPFGFLILGFFIFPIVNLLFRLFLNFIYYALKFISQGIWENCTRYTENSLLATFSHYISEKIIVLDRFEAKSRKNLMAHVISLTMCMLTIFMLLVLIVECIAFYVECAIYIVIGIILNSKDVLKFLSLIVLIALYGHDCFGSVSSKYKSFAKTVNTEIQGRVGESLKEVAMQTSEKQKEQAFTVDVDSGLDGVRMSMVASTEGYLKWNAKRLLLFLDTEDIPYIPRDFFFKTAKLAHFACPGLVFKLYLNALLELIWITLFLGFVMLVIMAFGEANNISGANQTLAALASGLLPFIFRKFLIRPHSGPVLDKGNLTWQTTLAEAINSHIKRWTVEDVDIASTIQTHVLHVPSEEVEPITVDLVKDIPENVDMIVKEHQEQHKEGKVMEFWVRKCEEETKQSVYIWEPGQSSSGQAVDEEAAFELNIL